MLFDKSFQEEKSYGVYSHLKRSSRSLDSRDSAKQQLFQIDTVAKVNGAFILKKCN